MTKERDYTITTWADGFGVWHARADFPYGCGNTGDGERLLANARRAARGAVRDSSRACRARADNTGDRTRRAPPHVGISAPRGCRQP